jgi:FG-GAP repeat
MRRTLVVRTVLVLACLLPVGGLQPNQVSALPSPSDPGPDFNGDGFADLAVGVPGEDPHDIDNAGSVHVI